MLVHDFGTVPKGTLLVHKLTITNIYDVPVQIVDIRKSCSCLEAYPPAGVLQPHETADFTVTMNSDKFTGANAQTFFITFGPQYVSTAVLQVKATSRADVTLTPGLVNFGVVGQGTKPNQSVSVKYAGRQKDWKITGVVPGEAPFDVQVVDAGRGPLGIGGQEYRVTVTLKPDAPPGPVAELITLKTNDPTAPLLQVNVSAVVQAPVSVSPGKVQFDDVKVGGPGAVQKVVVRATKPFRIQPVPDAGDGLTIETFPAAAPVQVVTVKYQPKTTWVIQEARHLPDGPGLRYVGGRGGGGALSHNLAALVAHHLRSHLLGRQVEHHSPGRIPDPSVEGEDRDRRPRFSRCRYFFHVRAGHRLEPHLNGQQRSHSPNCSYEHRLAVGLNGNPGQPARLPARRRDPANFFAQSTHIGHERGLGGFGIDLAIEQTAEEFDHSQHPACRQGRRAVSVMGQDTAHTR